MQNDALSLVIGGHTKANGMPASAVAITADRVGMTYCNHSQPAQESFNQSPRACSDSHVLSDSDY
jgi:hypothetical protein